MSNPSIPPEIAAMLEALEASGATVQVRQLDSTIGSSESAFEAERAKAILAMQAAGYDPHNACFISNAMTLCVDLGGGVSSLVEHMAIAHENIEAVNWLIATYRLTASLYPAIVKAEADTNNGFNFTNKDAPPGEVVAESERLIAELVKVRDTMVEEQSARKH